MRPDLLGQPAPGAPAATGDAQLQGHVEDVGLRRSDPTLTQEGGVAGTPAYMSPEQADGRGQLDARSDIYSLGGLAYFLLSGRPPFADRTSLRLLAAHLFESPPPLAEVCPGVPPDLADAVMRCLAKDPAERFPDVRAFERALAACCAGRWGEEEAARWWRAHAGSGAAGQPQPQPATKISR